ncbi:MAG TPA: pyridoxal-phosphate dependent enzyme, partial [Acidimicrobiia bacterium]
MRYLMTEDKIPSAWFNVAPHLPEPLQPPLHPGTGDPVGPDDLAPLFPMALIGQEMSAEPWIDIPGEVLDILKLWRPTPLVRATRLEKALDTPARIYFKDESVSPAGSHKPNTAVAQAFYNKAEGIGRISTETGAGQWGSAMSFACQLFGMECFVYMVAASYHQKPYRRVMMETWGGQVVPSPSDRTQAGKTVLARDPDTGGSLGIAISEAVEDAATHPDT